MNKIILALTLFLAAWASAQDTVEFLNGAKLVGVVIAIHKAEKEIEFESTVGGRKESKRYPYASVHAVLWKGKRYVVTPKAEAVAANKVRTEAEVVKLIEEVGKTPPEWLDSTPLEYPEGLDLNWPEPAEGPWDNQKNMGQFIWDVINPNESRWRQGIRLMYHLLKLHEGKAVLQKRVQESLGAMYFRFFQDYPRAAYWWRKSGVTPGSEDSVGLAECYWRLGNKAMAQKMLGGNVLRLGKIKLLGDMGETAEALRLADSIAPRLNSPHEAYLLAGDVCRLSGRYQDAIKYYQKTLDEKKARNEDYAKRYQNRAKESMETIQRFELLNLAKIPDGAYTASSMGYEGPVEVATTVSGGRIEKVEITKHREKQYYSALRDVPNQIIQKQSLKNVDATSRATITAVAVINATAKALSEAPKPPP